MKRNVSFHHAGHITAVHGFGPLPTAADSILGHRHVLARLCQLSNHCYVAAAKRFVIRPLLEFMGVTSGILDVFLRLSQNFDVLIGDFSDVNTPTALGMGGVTEPL